MAIATAVQSAAKAVNQRLGDRISQLAETVGTDVSIVQVSGPTITSVQIGEFTGIAATLSVVIETSEAKDERSSQDAASIAAISRAERRRRGTTSSEQPTGVAEAAEKTIELQRIAQAQPGEQNPVDQIIDRVELAGGKIIVAAGLQAEAPSAPDLLRSVGEPGGKPSMRGVFDD